MSETLITQFRGKKVTLTRTEGYSGKHFWKIGGTKYTVSMGVRFFVVREGMKVVTIKSTLRAAIKRAMT